MTIVDFFEKNKDLIQLSNDADPFMGNVSYTLSGELLEMFYSQIIHLDDFRNVRHIEIISDQDFKAIIDAFYQEHGPPQISYVPGEDEFDEEEGITISSVKVTVTPRFDEYPTYNTSAGLPEYIRIKEIKVILGDNTLSLVRLKVLDPVDNPNLELARVINPLPPII